MVSATLPVALLRAVFTFLAAPSGHREWQRYERHQSVAAVLRTVALVCREWRAAAEAVNTALVLRSLGHHHHPRKSTTRSDLVELRRRATLRGAAFLRELSVAPTAGFSAHDWRSIVAHAPLLEMLDLSRVPRPEVVACGQPVIEAVAALCPRLRALQLPWVVLADERIESPRQSVELLDCIVRGLAKWGPHGGLRRLTLPVPFVHLEGHHNHAAKFLDALAEHCPRLAILDGYEDMTLRIDRLVCDEQWHVDTETWQRFCASCTQLKAFNWVVAPFATAFFEIFGRYAKPQLTTLTFATPMNWDWQRYHRYRPSLHPRGYGATAVDAHLALHACPALTSLDVQLYQPGELYMNDPFADQTPVNPDQLMLNQEIFGDDFCVAIARHCPQLERFTIWCVAESATGDDHRLTIASFTDASMHALATLPRLSWMQFRSVNITGDGLFALCTGFAHGTHPHQRDFEIGVGDKTGTPHAMAFYEVVERFLTRLATAPPESALSCSIPSQRVLLRLLNRCYDNIDREWSRGFLSRVRPLMEKAKRAHPQLRLRMMARAFSTDDNGSFDRIFEFNFYSASAEISDEYEWKDRNDTLIDDVFVDRGLGGRGDDDDDDDDEAFDY